MKKAEVFGNYKQKDLRDGEQQQLELEPEK